MNKASISLFIWAILLILAQVLVFNRICLFGVAVPFVFLYILIKLPITLSREWMFTIGFAVGMIIDIFSDTRGINALSATILMAFRRPILRLYVSRDDELSDPYPGIESLGMFAFLKYSLTFTFVYCTLAFLIESFSVLDPLRLVLKIVSSTVLSTMLIIGIDSLTMRKSEKRL